MFQAIRSCCVASFEDVHCGTGLCVTSECDGEILAVPLHKCLVVLDKYKSPHEHRGSIEVGYVNVRHENLYMLKYCHDHLGSSQLPQQLCRSFLNFRWSGVCSSQSQFVHTSVILLLRKKSGWLHLLRGCDGMHMKGRIALGGRTGCRHCPIPQELLCYGMQVIHI